MKKVSLIVAAFALVLGLSQCNKEKTPAMNGETQHIVLTANNGNDGSKVSGSFDSNGLLQLTWDNPEEDITVSGGAEGTLTFKSAKGTSAIFEGDITKKGEGNVVFTLGDSFNCEGQDGTANGCASWISEHNYFVGTSPWQDNGEYDNVTMELQYAVLKLDVSALGASDEMKIAAGGSIIASVTDVASSAGKTVFVVVPANGTPTEYTITCGGTSVKKTWTLAPNTTYTASGTEGGSIVIEPAAPSYTFTVGEGKTVTFAPGNLYWDGSAFHFEADQWSTTPASEGNWDASHVSHFYWSNTTDWQTSGKEPYAASYSFSTQTTSDVFFTNATETTANPSFQVDGETGWRTLSYAEWNYLLNSRTNAANLRAWKELDEGAHKGLVILPDGTENPSTVFGNITSTAGLATYGAVFLPAAGDRYFMAVYDVGLYGLYWSSTPDGDDKDCACIMYFNSGGAYPFNDYRNLGYSVRLVR